VSGLNTIRDVVDQAWAQMFGPVDFRAPGVRVVVDPPGLPKNRIILLRLGEGCTIGVPAGISVDVSGLSADDVFHLEVARRFADGLALGPSYHHYADASTFVPQERCDARRVGDADGFRELIDPDEWSEAGFHEEEQDVWYGCFDDGERVAMGNMTDFAGRPADVGLVTRPDARGKGYATRLAGAMVADALEVIEVVRYRALFTNVASLAVARKLGFVNDGSNIVVRLLDS
jgi:GNAT superfamily N-acetyltransferase